MTGLEPASVVFYYTVLLYQLNYTRIDRTTGFEPAYTNKIWARTLKRDLSLPFELCPDEQIVNSAQKRNSKIQPSFEILSPNYTKHGNFGQFIAVAKQKAPGILIRELIEGYCIVKCQNPSNDFLCR